MKTHLSPRLTKILFWLSILLGFLCPPLAEADSPVWTDDFESYQAGKFPSPNWTYSGNSAIAVDNTTHVSGNQSLRMYGSVGGCWGALVHRPLQVAPPFTVEFYVRNGSEKLTGCHPDRGGMSLNTGPSWTTSARSLIAFNGDGTILAFPVGDHATGRLLGNYASEQWIKVKVSYDIWDSGSVKANFWINDEFKGTDFQPTINAENQLAYLTLAVGEGTAWFDDIKVTPGFEEPSAPPVSPTKATNVGQVTLTLTGQVFTPATQVSLVSQGHPTLSPSQTIVVSPTTLQAVFNLAGAATGVYDVVIAAPATVYPGAFEITAGSAGKLTVSLDAPPAVRNARFYPWTVKYSNDGGADIAPSLFVVSNNANADMALNPSEPFRSGSLQILGVNLNPPAGTLPPGSSNSLPVFLRVPTSVPSGSIGLKVEKLVADSTLIDWASIESAVRPTDMDSSAWAIIWSNFKSHLGNTWADYLQTLSLDANYISLHHRSLRGILAGNQLTTGRDLDTTTYDVRTLLQFEFAQAAGALNPRSVLAAAQDVSVPEPGLALSFGRFAPLAIQGRFRVGALGRGWAHTYEYSASVDANGIITIQGPGDASRSFYPQRDGSYLGLPGDYGSAALKNGAVTLTEKDGMVWQFAANGTLASIADTNGNRLNLSYVGGKLSAITHSNGESLNFVYNGNGWISEIHDPTGRVVVYRYAADQLAQVEKPGGAITAYAYHAADGTPAARALTSLSFPDGTHYFYNYDAKGRLAEEFRDGGAEHIAYAYDELGTVKVTDALNHTASIRFGAQGQVLDVQDPLGALAKNAYDAKTQLTQLVGPDGKALSLAYDGKGNPVGIINPLNQLVRMAFEPTRSRLTGLTDARANQTQFGYDGVGNLQAITYPDASIESFAYDPLGNVSAYTNRRHGSIAYTHNSRGQITRKTYPDGRIINYGYDAKGNLTSATDILTGAVTMQYDDRDFLTRIQYSDGRGFTFASNAAGRRTRRTGLDGDILNYQYDSAGRLSGLTDGQNQTIVAYSYDVNGRLANETKSNGTQTSYEYDSAGQLLHLVNYSPGGSVLSRFDYTYDANGNRMSMATLASTTQYQYDDIGQLAGVTYPDGGQVNYQYDAAGNRTAVTDHALTTQYTTNNLNQYTQVGSASYGYDADGNLVSKTDATGTTSYQYDAENRLVKVVTPKQGTWEYTYDALGNRIAVNHSGVVTRYVHDPIGLVDVAAEYDGSGALVARYTHGLGLVARNAPSGPAYYAFDGIGHTRQLTNATGAVVNSYDYAPFGEPLQATETVPNPFRYVGRFGVMGDGNGLEFMRTRFYDSSLGRFSVLDSRLNPSHLGNIYLYVGNNPLSFFDPVGTDFKPIDILTFLSIFTQPVLEQAFPSTKSWNGPNVVSTLTSLGTTLGGILARGTPYSPEVLGLYTGGHIFVVGSSFLAGCEIGRWIDKNFGNQIDYAIDWWLNERFRDYLKYYKNRTEDDARRLADKLREYYKLTLAALENSPLVTPRDPNEKVASAGVGTQHYVAGGDEITYQIYFENKSTATAPAQEVFINDSLDADLDWSTFKLGTVAFGNQSVSSLAGQQTGSDRLPTGNLLVDIVAAYDAGTGKASWTLRGIDPKTGDLPQDALAGFLPPEDGTGRGQGYISFKVKTRTDRPTGTQFTNTATIVFDTEAPLTTNQVSNTLNDTAAAYECLFGWAETNYASLFAPSGSPTALSFPYTYRYYSASKAYLGVSSINNHVYYLGPDGKLQDAGSASYWLPKAGCRLPPPSLSECLFGWAETNYPSLFAPPGSPTKDSPPYVYRYYSATNDYLGVSSGDNHVYYLGANGTMQDVGLLSFWLPRAGCQ